MYINTYFRDEGIILIRTQNLFFNKMTRTVFFFLFILSTFGVQAQTESNLIADGAKLTLISDQFSFTEGPAADKSGNVFFTDQPNDKIWKYDTKGNLSLYMDKTGRSNGLFFDKKGNLLSCADENNQIWQINKKKKVKVLVDNYQNLRFNGPNDLWPDGKGGIYFTDPHYQRPYWTRKPEEKIEKRVYYKDKKGNVRIAADEFMAPNGIIGNLNSGKLYIADIMGGKTYSFKMAPNGDLTDRTLFCSKGSDGMTVDEQGNIYLTGKGVFIFNPAGEQIGHIDVPEGWTANVTFGGIDRKTLFITASKSLYSINMKVKGVN